MTVEEFIKKWQEENPLEKAAKKLFEGALCGEFYIGENRKVRFSRGNLQFNAQEGTHATADSSCVQGTWRFAENQYDYIGELNGKISAGYKGWVDLFGWGTSGWNSGAKAYQPWATSDESESYYPGNNADNDLTGNFVNADWGVYNAISNGGNKPGKWRTLTTQEWQYLFSHNDWTMGKVAGTLCFLLLPEGFNAPQGITVVRLNDSSFTESQYSSNVYNAGQFKKLEELGVVALPCAGRRYGTSVDIVGSYGGYWSSSASIPTSPTVSTSIRRGLLRPAVTTGSTATASALSRMFSNEWETVPQGRSPQKLAEASSMEISAGEIRPKEASRKEWGCSVRLVQDV